MKIKTHSYKTITCIFLFALSSCGSANKNGQTSGGTFASGDEILTFSVQEAPEWTSLFHRKSGWFGADGIFSIPMSGADNAQADAGTETMLIFSDTMIGEISDTTLRPGAVMVNNTVAFLTGKDPDKNKITFHWNQDDKGNLKALFIPDTPSSEKGDYYWLGDGFVNTERNNTTYIFAYRMRNMDKSEAWSFKEMSTDLIALPAASRPPFRDQRQIVTPFRFNNGGFGAGIFVNTKKAGAADADGYVYVYGVRDKQKGLIVARVLPEHFEDFDAWRFWDGRRWNEDMQQVASVVQGVSNELSVSQLPDGRYALVFQLMGMGPTVGLRLGETPFGPFGPIIELWHCNEGQRNNYFTYNAKAHPSLSGSGELLISYNVNAFEFLKEINANPNLYRPRFIRVKLKQ